MIIANKKCVGCSACYSICPKKCIDMEMDSEGFYFPKVNKERCVGCNRCESVCPAIKQVPPTEMIKSYAAYSKDNEARRNSSSGAVFYQIARECIKNNGVVFGAEFDGNWNVRHSVVDNVEDLHKIQTSKYAQSNTNGIYKDVKKSLANNKRVVFAGTPCQCNALSLFLGKKYENLVIIDFVCHGVPSPLVWNKYLKSICDDVTSVNFRDKSNGWKNYKFSVKSNDKDFKIDYYDSTYMRLFLSDLILRSSCYDCKSKFPNKTSDITLGDLWGAGNIVPELDDDKGLSLVILNSKKGEIIFEEISSYLIVKEIDYNEAFKYNPSAILSATKPKNREKAFSDIFNNVDFDSVVKKHIKTPSLAKRAVKKFINFFKTLKILEGIR